jgi:hypothetical protein
MIVGWIEKTSRPLSRQNLFLESQKRGGKSRPRSKVTFEFGMGVLALNHGLRQ